MSTSRKLVIVSVAIGVAASLFPTLGFLFVPGPFGIATAVPMLISLALMVIWIIRFVFVLIQHRRKGLWFLVGLPFGVLWPLWVFAIWWACAAHWSCF